MSTEFWRALLVVHKEDGDFMDGAIRQLLRLGIDNVHVFAQAGVRLSKHFDHSAHQDDDWTDAYSLWRGMAEVAGHVYSTRSKLFLIVRPRCYIWEQLPTYCELTIDPNQVAIWSPLTPARVYSDYDVPQPQCVGHFGWCPVMPSADIGVNHCFVVGRHMLPLMASYLSSSLHGGTIGNTLAFEMSRREVPYYFHLPSLVDVVDDEDFSAEDFVGVSYHMPQQSMRQGNYLLQPRVRSCRR